MTTTSEETPQKAAVDAAILAAYAAEDCLRPDGLRDMTKIRERILAVVREHKVLSRKERETKAITRGQLVREVFPSLTAPEQFGEADDPQLALAVWKEISQMVWGEVKPGPTGPIQRLVGVYMGNGYALCRTLVGANRVGAVYVTDDRQCIDEDLFGPENASLLRKIDAALALREMLISRRPQDGRHWATDWDNRMKSLSVTGHDRLKLAIEAASPAPADETGDEPEE